MRIVQGQVRGTSPNGREAPTEPFSVGGFTPGTKAHVVLTGWSFEFTYGDHPILKMGIWLQQDVQGVFQWCHDVDVRADGTIVARYIGFAGSENMDNPFTFLVNYAVIGE